jgi:Acyl-CoA dehydrogenase, C-terminal domain
VLKAIENFAVECSINKVWSSEALAYAVDEAVQVFGGNGYSREFPVERAYRDARITRIYEGTNEINRLIIATRLLKNTESLLKEADARLEGRAYVEGSTLEPEHGLLGRSKRLAIAALSAVSQAYGQAAREEQELLAHIANVVIEIYAIESAVARAEKLSRRNSANGELAADVVRTYSGDAADRIAHDAKQIINALATRFDRNEALDKAWATVLEHKGIDSVAARRRIGDAAIQAGRYPF